MVLEGHVFQYFNLSPIQSFGGSIIGLDTNKKNTEFLIKIALLLFLPKYDTCGMVPKSICINKKCEGLSNVRESSLAVLLLRQGLRLNIDLIRFALRIFFFDTLEHTVTVTGLKIQM